MFRRWKSVAQPGACGTWPKCGGGGVCANCGGGWWKSCGNAPGRPAWKALNSESSAPAFWPADDRKPCYGEICGCQTSLLVLTCDGDCRPTKRSCCNVRSTVVCFWKFWRAFEGPQSASAMAKGRKKRYHRMLELTAERCGEVCQAHATTWWLQRRASKAEARSRADLPFLITTCYARELLFPGFAPLTCSCCASSIL